MANLGNYGSQLKIDDYNRALQAGGSSYQLQQPPAQQSSFAASGPNPYASAPAQAAPAQQAADTEVPYMRRASAEDDKRDSRFTEAALKGGGGMGGGKLGQALGIVGKIAAFL